jgi:microcystin degradation protein MlrC
LKVQGERILRFAIGGLSNEANSFAPYKVGMDWIRARAYCKREEIIEKYANTSSVQGGMIDACKTLGVELAPTIYARAGASGIIKKRAYDFILNDLLLEIRKAGKVDGFLAVLHGGGIAENHDDLEGDILKAIRNVVGQDTIIGTTLDFHGKISEAQVEHSDLLNGYDLFPHTDSYDRGFELVLSMISAVNGDLKPTTALRKPRVLPNLQGEYSGRHPMTTLLEKVHDIEKKEEVVFATVNGGFPYCDTVDAGFSVVVTTDNDMVLAEEKADELADLIWSLRKDFIPQCTPIKQAVEEARRWAEYEEVYNRRPVILTDVGDSAGSGSYNDGTGLIKEMLEAELVNAAFGAITSPEAVEAAITIGVGNQVTLTIGGKTDDPLEVTGIVKTITDGAFIGAPRQGETKPRPLSRMGRTVVLRCGGIDLIIISVPFQFSDLEAFRSAGIEPTSKKYIAVKSPAHFRGAFEPIAKKIIEVDGPGFSNPNLKNFDYKKIRRPIYPLDDI